MFYGEILWPITKEHTSTFMYSARYFCSILNKSGFSRQVFTKVPNMKSHINPPSASRADICGQTDGHEKANRRFSRLCENA
jgi:hypothetical protein